MYGYAHRATIRHMGVGEPDSKGRGARKLRYETEARGRAAFLAARELETMGAFAQGSEAVWRCAIDEDVTARDEIDVAGAGVGLDGRWQVAAVKQVGNELRCFLRRAETGA